MKKSRYMIPLVAWMAAIVAISPCLTTIAYANPPSIPSSVEVAVSYADTEYRGNNVRACTYCFPTPWCGSAGVQFIGSSTNYNGNPTDTSNCVGGDWDGGAILVTNTGANPITFTGLTVELPLPQSGNPGSPSCPQPPRPITFDLWFGQQYYYGNHSTPAYEGGPITIPSGGQAIFAGTSSDGALVCPSGNYPSGPKGGTYDFDTSDANFLAGCTPTTDSVSDPRIVFSAAGYVSTTYIDAGHVIDTGGIDTGNCTPTTTNPEWAQENLGWRAASSTCGEACPTNHFEAVAPSGFAPTTVTVTETSTGTGATTLYATAAVAAIFIVATGFLALRRRRPPP